MFDSIRTHSKAMMLILVLLIIPSFVFFGIEGYTRMMNNSPVVARVGDVDITRAQWDRQHAQEVDRIKAQFPGVDSAAFETPAARYATLERMVRDHLQQIAARDERLQVGNQELAQTLQSIPEIADLRRADGSFDSEAYRNLIASAQGLTTEGFEARVRQNIAQQKVMEAVTQTSFASSVQADASLDAFYEQREVRLLRLKTQDYASQVEPAEDQLNAYYQAHQDAYKAPERAEVEFVVLSVDDLTDRITLNDADVRSYYEQNKDRLGDPQRRKASHILVSVAPDASKAERDEALKKAQSLLEQVKADPKQFADIARQNSQDSGSAAKGGDLGYIERNAMTPAFEQAVFALKKGEISDIVTTDFGYHIIYLADIENEEPPAFDKVRATIEKDLRQQEARKLFAQVGEEFREAVFAQDADLKEIADKFKLKLQSRKNITRTPQADKESPLASAEFLQELFSEESLNNKYITKAVDLNPSQIVAGRMVSYSAAHVKPLEDVKADVRKAVVNEQAAALARADGEKKLAEWKSAPEKAELPEKVELISRTQPQSPAIIDTVLNAKADRLPVLVGVDLGAEGYAIARIDKVLPRSKAQEDDAGRTQQYKSYERSLTEAEAAAYYDLLKIRYKVQMRVDEPVV